MRSVMLLGVLLLLVAPGCQQTPSTDKASANAPADKDKAALPVADKDRPPLKGLRQFMRAKLAHAQAVLEGLARRDFDQIQTNADTLLELSNASDWQVHRTLEYNLYSDEFRWNVKELSRHAGKKNLHAAAMDYMELTMTCIRCHDYMQEAGLVRRDDRSRWRAALLDANGQSAALRARR